LIQFPCACPTVISSISGKSFHFPFPYFVIYVAFVADEMNVVVVNQDPSETLNPSSRELNAQLAEMPLHQELIKVRY
jgi:hypothetical protein